VAVAGDALKVADALTVIPATRDTELGLKVMVRPVGTMAPAEREIVPAKPLRLDRAIASVPVEPDANEILVDFTVNP